MSEKMWKPGDVTTDVETMQKHFTENGIFETEIPKDGHCILTAWSWATKQDYSDVEHALIQEVTGNIELYSAWSTSDIVEDLERYLAKRDYACDMVDFVINALVNASGKVCIIYECYQGAIRTTTVEPIGKKDPMVVTLSKYGLHYNLCNIKGHQKSNNQTEVIVLSSDDENENFIARNDFTSTSSATRQVKLEPGIDHSELPTMTNEELSSKATNSNGSDAIQFDGNFTASMVSLERCKYTSLLDSSDDSSSDDEDDSIEGSEASETADSEQTGIALEDNNLTYLHNDMSLPIYSQKKEKYSTQDIIKIMLDTPKKHAKLVCKKCPHNIHFSSSYLVDLNCMDSIADIKGNDSCPMNHHGQPLRYIYVRCNDDGLAENVIIKKRSQLDETEMEEEGIQESLFMYEYASKNAKGTFSRRIYTLYKDADKTRPHRYAFVNFYVAENHMSEVPHGNSKRGVPFKATKHSVPQSIKQRCEHETPKRVLAEEKKRKGSFAIADCSSDLPRNYNQIKNFRRKATNSFVELKNDEIVAAMYECKKPGDEFVREVQGAPEAICILATNT